MKLLKIKKKINLKIFQCLAQKTNRNRHCYKKLKEKPAKND